MIHNMSEVDEIVSIIEKLTTEDLIDLKIRCQRQLSSGIPMLNPKTVLIDLAIGYELDKRKNKVIE